MVSIIIIVHPPCQTYAGVEHCTLLVMTGHTPRPIIHAGRQKIVVGRCDYLYARRYVSPHADQAQNAGGNTPPTEPTGGSWVPRQTDA